MDRLFSRIFIYIFILLIVNSFSVNELRSQDADFFIFLNTNPDKERISKEEVNELQKKHLDNIARLFKEGIILAAGPFNSGGGIFIMRASSRKAIDSLLLTDPAIKAKRFIIEIFPAEIIYGKLCEIGEDYKMKEYTFIRYSNHPNSITNKDLKEIRNQHFNYFNNLNDSTEVLSEISLNKSEGGVMIIKKSTLEYIDERMNEDPYLKNGIYDYTGYTLWIADQTFCD